MTQLTIEKIYPLADGAKSGGLKATNGQTYKFLPWQLKFIKEGAEIDVPITESPYNGKTYYWFSKDWPSKDAQNAARNQPAPSPAPHPAPASASSNGYTKDAAMFVMGVVGRAMGSGQFGATDVKTLALAAVDAWNEVKGRL